jgi:2-C-methyl-D-erythritol 4-phosphate cytidylyltransferase/2-C-methyl-D-erythritol 2,4-cyclodiphosphate synthase
MSAKAQRRIWAVVPAAGRGERFSSSAQTALPKQYAPLFGRTVLEWTLSRLLGDARIERVMVALAPGDVHFLKVRERLGSGRLHSTGGGAHRQASVLNGIAALRDAAAEDFVLVHDAARPCLGSEDLAALIDALADDEVGAVLAAPIHDTMKRETAGRVHTVEREGLWRALTPQIFKLGVLREALESAARDGVTVTDEAQAIERAGASPRLVAGSPFNIKVTRAEDLALATEILRMNDKATLRIGQGTDVHAYGEGDHVVLGGVRIPHTRGVLAHSDGDVVIHALCDAVLGALGAGDIGQHFPDSDPKYRGADSRVFLREVAARMHGAGYRLLNADITVLAEAPRIGKYRIAMAENLAADLKVEAAAVNVKATTTEKLGFIGRQEGLAAQAAVLLSR